MKKKVIVVSVFILLIVLFFPIRYQLKDGGSVQYKSLTYKITKVHSLVFENEAEKQGLIEPYRTELIIELLGFEIYNNVR